MYDHLKDEKNVWFGYFFSHVKDFKHFLKQIQDYHSDPLL